MPPQGGGMRNTMASLIETFIDVLNQEEAEYEKLLELSEYKTSIIVKNDVDELQTVLLKEQALLDSIDRIEEKRSESVKDICDVLNLKASDTKLEDIVRMLEKQPKEHRQLEELQARLKKTMGQLMKINENNKVLVRDSLDMVEFELNLAKNAMLAPQTANYSGSSYDNNVVQTVSGFDAKQ
jgi:ABC-type phosphate transport system auxiliary subunit